MNTIKLSCTVFPPEEWAIDLLAQELADAGFDMFNPTEEGLEAFIPEKQYSPELTNGILSGFNSRCAITGKVEVVAGQNWNEVWEKNYFQPLVIQGQVVVKAPFHDTYPHCHYEITIEPKMAFGTGNHETTTLMMELLLGHDLAGKSLLDMGCGTGILAILSSMLGADPVTAIDNDEWAFAASCENIVLNKTPNITPLLGDARLLGNDTFDIVLANIQRNVIISDLPAYARVLLPGGWFFASGFHNSDTPEIEKAASSVGLTLFKTKELNNWTAALFHKP